MSTKAEKAVELFKNGHNCAQAVIGAFCEECGISEKDAFRISEGFGAGMSLQEVCGAVSGMNMVISLLNSSGDPANVTKADTYRKVKACTQMFADKNGSYICRELKNTEGGKARCSCEQCVMDAAALAEAFLKTRE